MSAFPAINYLKIYYRSTELSKSQVLSTSNNFDQFMSLSSEAVGDLSWIINNHSKYDGCFIGPRPPSITMKRMLVFLDGVPHVMASLPRGSGLSWKLRIISIT